MRSKLWEIHILFHLWIPPVRRNLTTFGPLVACHTPPLNGAQCNHPLRNHQFEIFSPSHFIKNYIWRSYHYACLIKLCLWYLLLFWHLRMLPLITKLVPRSCVPALQLCANRWHQTGNIRKVLHNSELSLQNFLVKSVVIQNQEWTLLGICSGTPFLRKVSAVSGCPYWEAICIKVLPSLVRAEMEALHLSTRRSTMVVCPRSAAMWTGTRSICIYKKGL